MASAIEPTLAVALAGQVAAGLTPGEGQEDRMRGALLAIGLMLRNATELEMVGEVLSLIDRSTVTEHVPGAVTRIESRPAR